MSEPYQPPSRDALGAEEDPLAAVPGLPVRAAGVALMVAGMTVAASGLQLGVFFVLHAWWLKLVTGALLVLGAAATVLGGFYFQARSAAVFASVAVAGILAAGTAAWALYTLLAGVVSPLMLLAAVLSWGALLTTVAAAPSALRTAAARAALYDAP